MSFGITEMLLVLLIILIIFGAGKLPQVMGDVAKGVRSFRAGLKDGPEDPPVDPPPARLTDARGMQDGSAR